VAPIGIIIHRAHTAIGRTRVDVRVTMIVQVTHHHGR